MAIIKRPYFYDIENFFENINNLAKDLNYDFFSDIYEENGNLIVEMSIAGINPDNIDITVEDDYIKVVGHREEEHQEKKRQYFKKEIKRGSFERIIDLPTAVEADKAKAEVKNGILIITLPKINKKESRKIQISK